MPDPSTRPSRFQRVKHTLEDRPHWSHTGIYRLAGEHDGLLRKMGRSTLVDLVMLDEIEAALPPADIKPDVTRTVPVRRADLPRQAAPDRAPGAEQRPHIRRAVPNPL